MPVPRLPLTELCADKVSKLLVTFCTATASSKISSKRSAGLSRRRRVGDERGPGLPFRHPPPPQRQNLGALKSFENLVFET